MVKSINRSKFLQSGILLSGGLTLGNKISFICCLSRLPLISGKHISRTKVWGDRCWLLRDDIPSLLPVLQKNGYDTILSGGMHFDKTRRYGFTELLPDWENQYTKTGVGEHRAPDDTLINYIDWKSRSESFDVGQRNPTIMNQDKNITKLSSNYIKKRTPSDKSFFMVAGYLISHFSLTVPEKYYSLCKVKFFLPKALPSNLAMQLGLNEQQFSWKDFTISEYYSKYTASGYFMYRSDQCKYVYHSKSLYSNTRELQFFDMKNDPNELVNMETAPEYQK